MTRQTVSRWALLIGALVLTMVLAGCGGDDGVSQSVHDQVQQEKDEAERKAAEEEAARMEAERKAAEEEAARMEAERKAAEEEAARMARIEEARHAIAMAETAAAAQAAYDAVKDDATVTEGVALQTAVDMRITELETMAAAAAQKNALVAAAGNIDTSDLMTADDIAAATTAINALKAALAAAADVSEADKAMYQAMVDAAETAVMTAQGALDHAAQTTALMTAVTNLQAIDLSGLMTQDDIDAANTAIYALNMALEMATELSAAEKSAALVELATAKRTVMTAQGRVDHAGQMEALTAAVAALEAINLDNLMTQQQIDDAEGAIIAVDLALEMATDLTAAETLDATVDVTVAKRKLAAAKTTLADNIEMQKTALMAAGTALGEIDLSDLSDEDKIAMANTAISILKKALEDATHVSDAEKAMYQTQLDTATDTVRMAETGMDASERMMAQREALTTTMAAAQAAVNMVDDDATDAQVMAANKAITDLQAAIAGAVDLPEGSTDMAQGALDSLKKTLASAEMSRMTAMAEAEKTADADMMATAAKLYAGIFAPIGSAATPGANDRAAAYSSDDTAILVSSGDRSIAPTEAVSLSEDKKMMIAANYGWKGKRYTAESESDGMYEAIVYSLVGEPMEGDMISTILTEGVVPGTTLTAENAGNVASPSFDQSAGGKSFPLPEPNLLGQSVINISGSYSGVPGNYMCTPAEGSQCTATKVDSGFTLTGGTWSFKPTDPMARLMGTPDGAYASYGWWLHKSADDTTYTASAFVDNRGTEPAALNIAALRGTAEYSGGAAGKYALSSSTGGTNDAGHFTARAMLNATFAETHEISGVIDNFIGADGQMRNWKVELNKSTVSDLGAIAGDPTVSDSTAAQMTVWTIDGMAAAAAGQWSGSLQDVSAGGVPMIATGTFHSEYGTSGSIIGGFGADTGN